METWRLIIFIAAGSFFLSCQVNLYSSLEESESTEMMAVLLQNGIDCEKAAGKKDNVWSVKVIKADVPRAVHILKAQGLPRDKFQNIGQVFKEKGLVSSPAEDRIRFIFALSQEIAETISRIDGVLSARVHIVLPENDPLSDTLKPSSASVFIKCNENDTKIHSQIPKIKEFIINSVEGLSINKITVALFGKEKKDTDFKYQLKSVLGVSLNKNSVARFWAYLLLLLLAFAASSAYAIYLQRRYAPRRALKAEPGEDSKAEETPPGPIP